MVAPSGKIASATAFLIAFAMVLSITFIISGTSAESDGLMSVDDHDFIDGDFAYRYIDGSQGNTVIFAGCLIEGTSSLEIPDTAYNKDNGSRYIVTTIGVRSIPASVENLSLGVGILTINQPCIDVGEPPYGIKLKTITIEDGNPIFKISNGMVVLKDIDGVILMYPASDARTSLDLSDAVRIGEYTFLGAGNLKEVKLNDEMTVLMKGVFCGCGSLEKIYSDEGSKESNLLPKSLVMIDSLAFYGCASLERFASGAELTTIGDEAFSHCASLSDIYLGPAFSNLGLNAFSYCESLKDISVSEDNKTFVVDADGAYAGILKRVSAYNKSTYIALYPAASDRTVLMIGSDIDGIDRFAFATGNGSLEEVYYSISGRVDEAAFSGCQSLKRIHLNSTVLMISDFAFSSCSSLETVTGCDNVLEIRSYAFSDCIRLTAFDMPKDLKTIKSFCFTGSGLKDVVIPDSVAFIEYGAFQASSMEKIKICGHPDIGYYALDTEGELTILKHNDMKIPDTAYSDLTKVTMVDIDEWHFPMYNLVGIIICLLILAGMVLVFRRI